MKTNTYLKIGQVSALSGVSVDTIRYYEQIGLLTVSERNESRYRLYSPDIIQRLKFIKTGQKLGFLLPEIQELLALKSSEDPVCENIK